MLITLTLFASSTFSSNFSLTIVSCSLFICVTGLTYQLFPFQQGILQSYKIKYIIDTQMALAISLLDWRLVCAIDTGVFCLEIPRDKTLSHINSSVHVALIEQE